MANVICKKCGLTGDSKCPFCRSVFGDNHTAAARLDSVMSHRLKISLEQITIKKYNHDGPEDDARVVSMLVNTINKAVATDKSSVEEVCKIVCCLHEWDFAPHHYSNISCGHRAPADPDFESSEGIAKLFADAGLDPEEVCECGDKLKAHRDSFECACCHCAVFTPIKKEEVA